MESGTGPKLSADEYRLIVEQAPILIWRAGVEGECDYFNERWLAFTGRSLAQEAGSGWAEGVHPDDLDRCLGIYLGAFRKREVFEMEYRLRRHDGDWRWIFDRGVPVYGDDGAFAGYVGSCVDIHDRVEARAALDRAKEREIHTLRGLLPICSHCKRIRDEFGNWRPLESYIRDHSQADFTHGICAACLSRDEAGR
jgi:PAS domain S-box-containing protein